MLPADDHLAERTAGVCASQTGHIALREPRHLALRVTPEGVPGRGDTPTAPSARTDRPGGAFSDRYVLWEPPSGRAGWPRRGAERRLGASYPWLRADAVVVLLPQGELARPRPVRGRCPTGAVARRLPGGKSQVMTLALIRASGLTAIACSLARSRQRAVDADVRGVLGAARCSAGRAALRSTSCPGVRTPRRRGGRQRRVRRRRTNSGLVPVVCPVGRSHRDRARAATAASGRRSGPTDVDARPRTVALHVPVVSGTRRSAQAEDVVPATCPIGWPLEGRRRTTAYSDQQADQPEHPSANIHGRSPTKFPS